MRAAGAVVEVEPATILPAFQAMREAARACTDVGWRLTSHTPVMPPGFLVATRAALETAAANLHRLAADLEAAAVAQWWRLSAIEVAGGGRLRVPLSAFAGDLAWAGRIAYERLRDERGFDIAADPPGRIVHAALGDADAVLSLWHTAAVLVQGTPLYGTGRPGGREARHEIVAMGLNLLRMSLPWAAIEPEDAGQAYLETVRRAIDAPDLESGDVFRWGGHVGTGLALGKGLDAAAATEAATAVDGAPGEGAEVAGITQGAYRGVSEANRVPPSPGGRPRTAAGRAVRRVEDEIGRFLETAVP